eukprot:854180-Prymnesium_polylepis.1
MHCRHGDELTLKLHDQRRRAPRRACCELRARCCQKSRDSELCQQHARHALSMLARLQGRLSQQSWLSRRRHAKISEGLLEHLYQMALHVGLKCTSPPIEWAAEPEDTSLCQRLFAN